MTIEQMLFEGDNALKNKDYKTALQFYKKSAYQGDPEGMYKYGNMFYLGHGVDENYCEALIWFEKAAEKGHAGAQYQMGYMYDVGLGVEKDTIVAEKWYKKSADNGDKYAQNELGWLYLVGRVGAYKRYAEIVDLFRKSAEQGLPRAMFNLGYMYEKGWGVEQNLDKAIYWYGQAVPRDYKAEKALKYLGRCCYCGGEFKGFLSLKCRNCGKPKDY